MLVVRRQNFAGVIAFLERRMVLDSDVVETERWQGRDVRKDPAARTYELRNVTIEVPLIGSENLERYRSDIRPNLPWADDHFLERVSGEPLNPGEQWKNWPWGRSADRFRDQRERFNHTYMERLWPKYARATSDGRLSQQGPSSEIRRYPEIPEVQNEGIAWEYGDLEDLVELLVAEPYTRQAWIPLFFPEDTGIGDGGRKPCTLGYQLLVRRGEVHLWYPLRSCDLVRHFRDDCYLAVRLLLWVIDRCRERSSFWDGIRPGTYGMHTTSLHVFENDMRDLRGETI